MVHQIVHGKSQGFIVIVSNQFNFARFFIRMQPITMGKAVGGIVSDHGNPFITLSKSALELNCKSEDASTVQLKPDSQRVSFIQEAVKFNCSHACILLALRNKRQKDGNWTVSF